LVILVFLDLVDPDATECEDETTLCASKSPGI
jgi:hypothetical protein